VVLATLQYGFKNQKANLPSGPNPGLSFHEESMSLCLIIHPTHTKPMRKEGKFKVCVITPKFITMSVCPLVDGSIATSLAVKLYFNMSWLTVFFLTFFDFSFLFLC